MADNGTIMLDEIAELPYEMQAKLLRVLQERKVRRIGEAVEQPLNIRVIAVTNKDLLALAKEGKFREDLYYRLNAMTLEVPSLKARKDDLPLLAEARGLASVDLGEHQKFTIPYTFITTIMMTIVAILTGSFRL